MASGFLFGESGELLMSTDATNARMVNGFLRSPQGEIVVDEVGPWTWKQGFLRTAGGALGIVQDAVPVAAGARGLPRTAAGLLIVTETGPPLDIAGLQRDSAGRLVVTIDGDVPEVPPGPFMQDLFNGSNGTSLQLHEGELGATWTLNGASTAVTDDTIRSNRLMGPAQSGTNIYYASAIPTSADYDVTAQLVILSDNNSSHFSAAGRMSTTADTCYAATYNTNGNLCTLFAIVNGVSTPLGTAAAIPASSLTLRMVGNQISVLVDDVQVIAPVTDSSITAAGRAGFRHGGLSSTTTGIHVDSIEATTADPSALVLVAVDALPADMFVDSMGINVHCSQTVASGGFYGDGVKIAAAMNYVGLKHMRDGFASPGTASNAPGFAANKLEYVATHTGGSIHLFLDESSVVGTDTEPHMVQVLGWINTYMPHVISIEGENEADNAPIGGSGVAAARQRQQWIYNNWADPTRPVLGMSYITDANYNFDQSDYMDAANAHPYPTQNLDTLSRLNTALAVAQKQAPLKPIYSTETGYNMGNCLGRTPATEDQHASWNLVLVLLGIQAGVTRTYLYELGNNDTCQWGLFKNDANHTPKKAANVLRDWLGLLDDTSSPTNATLTCAMNAPDYDSLLFAKASGKKYIVLYPTVEHGTATRNITLALSSAHTVKVFQPHLSTTATRTYLNFTSGTVGPINDDYPFAIEVS